jgi:hypothetical protein
MLMCGSDEHDPLFARWTGFWPGELEAVGLGMISTDGGPYVGADLNGFMEKGLHKIFFVKPKA